MVTKSFNQSLMALLLIAMPVMGADKRQIVTFNMPKHATVADVICSEHNGHVGFNMPLAPQFTHRGLFRSFPKGMSDYPAYYQTEAGQLTTAAIVRFIEQSPSLFTNKEEQTTYKYVLAEAVSAHKTWFANKSEANLVALRLAEDKAFAQLKRLSVNAPETRARLENILSSPARNIVAKMGRSCILPERSSVAEKSKTNKELVVRKTNSFKMFLKQAGISVAMPLAISLGILATTVSLTGLGWPKFNEETQKSTSNPKLQKYKSSPFTLALAKWSKEWENKPIKRGMLTVEKVMICFAIASLSSSIAASFTDFKLTPEPGNGIKVVINVAW